MNSHSRNFGLALVMAALCMMFGTVVLNASGGCGNLVLTQQNEIASTCAAITMTAHRDAAGRAALYVGAKDGGLKIYDITGVPTLGATIPVATLGGLHVMNLQQHGNRVFLALGNHFSAPGQSAGIAVIDVSDPYAPMVTGLWVDSASNTGGGIVASSDGRYVYLGAMGSGLVILEVSAAGGLRFVSRIVPSLAFPDANFDAKKINARGMAVVGDMVLLCYDAGGVRVINTADKRNPRETGRYSNPVMNGKPRAYNNIVVEGRYAYVAVDYCGIEVLDISDTSAIRAVGWWNPWNCHISPLNWFTSAGHANEIVLDPINSMVFVSTGKSDMYAVSVANPAAPDSCRVFGGTENGIGTWGVSRNDDELYLTYICTLGIPFASNWTGVKTVKYAYGSTAADGYGSSAAVALRREGRSVVATIPAGAVECTATIADLTGKALVRKEFAAATTEYEIALPDIPGVYVVTISVGGVRYAGGVFCVP